jgi:hypothetical protein
LLDIGHKSGGGKSEQHMAKVFVGHRKQFIVPLNLAERAVPDGLNCADFF